MTPIRAGTGTEPASVVIAGGGPVGLLLAIELCLGGLRPVVLERLPEISDIPKSNGLAGQIVQVLDYRGLLEPLRAESTYTGPVPAFSFGPLQLDFSALVPSPLNVLAIPQRRLEHVLAGRLAELGGSIQRGHELTEFSQDDDAVTVTVTGPDGDRYQLRTEYLVGCDGAHSAVRKRAGIEFPGFTSSEVSLIGRVTLPEAAIVAGSGEIELPGLGRVPLTMQQRTPRGMYSVAPLTSLDATAPKGTYIVYTREDAEPAAAVPGGTRISDREPRVTLADLQASFRRVTGADVRMTDPTWLTRTVGNTRQADRYQNGRVLLAGDAAHVFGLALGVGLLDSINLGWKLAAQVQGRAPAALLASYHAERQAAGRRGLLHTRAQRALTGSGETADAIREVFGELVTLPGVARHLGELIAGTDVRYEMPDGAAPDPSARHPLAGRLAPDLRLTTQDGSSTRVAELMRAARPVLLDFTPDGRVVAGVADWKPRVPGMVVKADGPAAAADSLLIRPDGIVAWASRPGAADPAAGLAGALAAWFSS